jgi:hypothetical protein
MNFKCLLGFHKWEIDKEKFVLKCERCGKQKRTPELAFAAFVIHLLEIKLKSDAILALLMLGRSEEAKAKLGVEKEVK